VEGTARRAALPEVSCKCVPEQLTEDGIFYAFKYVVDAPSHNTVLKELPSLRIVKRDEK
jgi:hypothetical protein